MKDEIVLVGAGEHAKVVYDGMQRAGIKVVAIVDPSPQPVFEMIPKYAKYDASIEVNAKAIISIGNNETRQRVEKLINHSFANFIHDTAVVSTNSRIGLGCMIMSGALVQVDTQIGDHVILNTRASIDHDCKIGSFVHIAPGAVLCGRVTVGEGAFIGAGAVVIPGIEIGSWAQIGAGAVVIHDVPDGATVVGNPAYTIKSKTS
jgi:sugar O-acyltransferase (sialic acid O-acetyltransferase NeuD family)